MNMKELMIGDWVYNSESNLYQRVDELHYDCVVLDEYCTYDYADLAPIRIKEEVLKKNFEEKYGEIYGIYNDYFDLEIHEFSDGVYILHYHCSEFSMPDTQIVGICWVHELQHALRLCGITKEIEL